MSFMNNKSITCVRRLWPLITLAVLSVCHPKESSPDYQSRIKMRQYIAQGKVLYRQYCSNCHQDDGSGLGELYPPLLDSDYLAADPGRTICIIKNGQTGEIVVNGRTYNQTMPPNPGLTNLEVAEIATYVFNRFADTTLLLPVKQVDSVLKLCRIPYE